MVIAVLEIVVGSLAVGDTGILIVVQVVLTSVVVVYHGNMVIVVQEEARALPQHYQTVLYNNPSNKASQLPFTTTRVGKKHTVK